MTSFSLHSCIGCLNKLVDVVHLTGFINSYQAGLGGARDATNIITSSELAAAVITTIGKEHLAALGGSLESIALAKSGIIKRGCPVRWSFPHYFLLST